MVLRYLLSYGVPIALGIALVALVVMWGLRGRIGRPPGDRP
ncbi:hypothetical protein P6166_09505 [Stenotrophomonas sp. HITSZ_GD]|jgi:hypothetical protein|nr:MULTISPECIES: hypothetical protein [Stenotrophomonas]MDG2525589.1 hypothetical protein [Stenotrophomonas sp. HITSZ_GD]